MRVGFDLCDPKRIEQTYKRFGSKFLVRVFSEEEVEDLKSSKSKKTFLQRLAGRYSAKEAIAKLFGTGIGGQLSFRDIEVLKSDLGAPKVVLSEKASKLAESLTIKDIQLSISHEETMVGCVAVCN